jgi:hypothetical protein
MSKKIKVHFMCDASLDHTANMSDCITSSMREFDSLIGAQSFIDECTYVTNLDELFGVVPKEKVQGLDKTLFNQFID